jgi:hypothetical protein
MPKVIETVFDKSNVSYEVQTTFPGSNGKSRYGKFGSYYRWAYVHKDTPRKYLTHTHPTLFIGNIGDGCRFETYEEAKELADFLVAECRLHCGWDGNESWHIARREPLEARIVIHSSRETMHVVE